MLKNKAEVVAILCIVLIFIHPFYCQAYNGALPDFVVESKGGLTKFMKFQTFKIAEDFSQISIPDAYKAVIKKPEDLFSHTLCNTLRGQHLYTVCPDSSALLLKNNTKNFCCGLLGRQYCCNEADFRQGIQIIRPSLAISPSILIGCALATLFAMMMAALLVCGRFHYDRNPREPVSIIRPQNKPYSLVGPHARNTGASSVPPSGHLLSSDSGRHSIRHNRRSLTEYDV